MALLLITGLVALEDVNHFVDQGDGQNGQTAAEADLGKPERYREHALRHVVEAPGIIGHRHGVPSEIERESGRDAEREYFQRPAFTPGHLFNQNTDADDFATLERVGETEKRHRRHAPGRDVVAGRNIESDLPAQRHEHHDGEDEHQKSARRVARKQVKPVEKRTDHAAPFA